MRPCKYPRFVWDHREQGKNCESPAGRDRLGAWTEGGVANQTLAYFIMLSSSPERSSLFDLLGLSFVLLSHPTFFLSTELPHSAQVALTPILFHILFSR